MFKEVVEALFEEFRDPEAEVEERSKETPGPEHKAAPLKGGKWAISLTDYGSFVGLAIWPTLARARDGYALQDYILAIVATFDTSPGSGWVSGEDKEVGLHITLAAHYQITDPWALVIPAILSRANELACPPTE